MVTLDFPDNNQFAQLASQCVIATTETLAHQVASQPHWFIQCINNAMKSILAGFTDDANSKQHENVNMQQHSYKNG